MIRENDIPDQHLYVVANILLERLKLFSLYTKHPGFEEEREWRVVYFPDRDTDKRIEPMLSYSIGPQGVEPKLKFAIGPVDGATGGGLSLDLLISQIILGPSASGPLPEHGIRRMLERLGKPELVGKLARSSTPFRPS